MYCVLTKVGNTYDLPVVFVGTKVVEFICKRDHLAYQKNIVNLWTKEALKDVGIVRFEEPKMPVGQMTQGGKVDSLEGFVVTRKAVWVEDPDYVAPDPLVDAKKYKVADIKVEANRRILAIVPEWKQRNLTAQAAQFAKQVADGIPLTVEQQAMWDAGVAIWTEVAAIRTKSDELEASVDPMDLETVQTFDVTDDATWEPVVVPEEPV